MDEGQRVLSLLEAMSPSTYVRGLISEIGDLVDDGDSEAVIAHLLDEQEENLTPEQSRVISRLLEEVDIEE